MNTWFLVLLFAIPGDEWTIYNDYLPVEYSSFQECYDAGLSVGLSPTNTHFFLGCVNAEDQGDLVKVLLKNFNFGGQEI